MLLLLVLLLPLFSSFVPLARASADLDISLELEIESRFRRVNVARSTEREITGEWAISLGKGTNLSDKRGRGSRDEVGHRTVSHSMTIYHSLFRETMHEDGISR